MMVDCTVKDDILDIVLILHNLIASLSMINIKLYLGKTKKLTKSFKIWNKEENKKIYKYYLLKVFII